MTTNHQQPRVWCNLHLQFGCYIFCEHWKENMSHQKMLLQSQRNELGNHQNLWSNYKVNGWHLKCFPLSLSAAVKRGGHCNGEIIRDDHSDTEYRQCKVFVSASWEHIQVFRDLGTWGFKGRDICPGISLSSCRVALQSQQFEASRF